jgi:SAM-dependent methyltransferase
MAAVPRRAGAGAAAERMPSRNELILGPLDRSMRIIELGPSHAPIVPKADGWDVHVVDHAPREELVEKYDGQPGVDTQRIEEVDVVWRNGSLHEAFPPATHGTFDAVVASHVIEHVPDLLGLLVSLERLLRFRGLVTLVVPDKRLTFDFFKPLSTTSDLLAARRETAERHSRKTRFDDAAYSVSSRGEICWSPGRRGDLAFFSSLEQARAIFETPGVTPEDPYVDCHAWRFTPSSFELAVLELRALGETSLAIESVVSGAGCEFFTVLRTGAKASPSNLNAERLRLLKQTVRELARQAEWLDAPNSAEPYASGARMIARRALNALRGHRTS